MYSTDYDFLLFMAAAAIIPTLLFEPISHIMSFSSISMLASGMVTVYPFLRMPSIMQWRFCCIPLFLMVLPQKGALPFTFTAMQARALAVSG